MAPSRSRHKAVLHTGSSREPLVAVETGTPSQRLQTQNRTSTSSPISWRSATSVERISNGPRPSIDDDNGEGDQDLTSPGGHDDDILNLSGSGQSDDEGETADEDDEDNDGTPNGPSDNPATAALGTLQKSSSTPVLVSAPPNAFAPPFYNRPPTPLPPSPSLTSLLRPSFSSRPTTPDDSESEVAANGTAGEGSATEAAVVKSARDAKTVPRASPKVPTYEYYGFVLYLTSGLCFLMYLLWSYLPSPFLHQLGIYYYPDRWWSLATPAFLVMLLVYIYVALAAYNTEYLTPPLGSVVNVVDEAANVAAVGSRSLTVRGTTTGTGGGRSVKKLKEVSKIFNDMKGHGSGSRYTASKDETLNWKEVWNEGTDAVMDVPIGGVCEILYGDC